MNLLVVSPHPDDETLGAGGLMLKCKNEWKEKINWLNITNMDEKYGYSTEVIRKRMNQIETVKSMYQVDAYFDLHLEPAGIDKYSRGEIISKISEVISKVQPEVIVIPYKNDVHSDHRIIFDLVYSCTKVFRYPFIKKILCMEIISETDFALSDNGFVPNYFVNIENYLEQKIKIMEVYESELGQHPFPRSEESIRAQALLRGASSGVRYAEAFRLIKAIE